MLADVQLWSRSVEVLTVALVSILLFSSASGAVGAGFIGNDGDHATNGGLPDGDGDAGTSAPNTTTQVVDVTTTDTTPSEPDAATTSSTTNAAASASNGSSDTVDGSVETATETVDATTDTVESTTNTTTDAVDSTTDGMTDDTTETVDGTVNTTTDMLGSTTNTTTDTVDGVTDEPTETLDRAPSPLTDDTLDDAVLGSATGPTPAVRLAVDGEPDAVSATGDAASATPRRSLVMVSRTVPRRSPRRQATRPGGRGRPAPGRSSRRRQPLLE